MSESTFETVKTVLVEVLKLKDGEIQPTSLLKEDLNADSLDLVNILMELETACGITIPQENLPELKTVQDLAVYVDSHKE